MKLSLRQDPFNSHLFLASISSHSMLASGSCSMRPCFQLNQGNIFSWRVIQQNCVYVSFRFIAQTQFRLHYHHQQHLPSQRKQCEASSKDIAGKSALARWKNIMNSWDKLPDQDKLGCIFILCFGEKVTISVCSLFFFSFNIPSQFFLPKFASLLNLS